MKQFGGVTASIGYATAVLVSAGYFIEKSKHAVLTLEMKFDAEKKLLNIELSKSYALFDLEKKRLKISLEADKRLLEAKLSALHAAFPKEKKNFEEKMKAAVAAAELRTSEEYLRLGCSKEYHAYQETIKATNSETQ